MLLDGVKQEESEPYDRTVLIGRANALLDGTWKPDVDLPRPVISSDGASFAYPVRRGGKEFIVVDGSPGEAFDVVELPTWSPLGRRLAYVATWGAESYVVLDGVRGEAYDSIPVPLFSRNPVFSADGATLAYLARRGGRLHLVVEGRKSRVVPCEGATGLSLSPRGTRVAYIVGSERTRTFKGAVGPASVVVDGQAGPEFPLLDDEAIVFSPDGSRSPTK